MIREWFLCFIPLSISLSLSVSRHPASSPIFIWAFIHQSARANLDGVRACVLSRFMDEGPSGDGHSLGGMAILEEEIFDQLKAGAWGLEGK